MQRVICLRFYPFCLAAFLVVVLVVACAFSQAVWRPVFPATTQQDKQWAGHEAFEAKQLGTTLDNFRTFEKRLGVELGNWLLYDRKTDLGIWYEPNPDGSAREINITPIPGKRLKASVQYELGGKMPGRVVYSGDAPLDFSRVGRYAIWLDLNADGVFDELIIPEKRNDLLNLDKGTYILLHGQWTKAAFFSGSTMDRTVFIGNIRYDFDPASGRWISREK